MENEKESPVSFKKIFTITLYAFISTLLLSAVVGGCYLIATYGN